MAGLPPEPLQVEPLRNLRFWHIWALGVGAVIGDGIFLLIGQGIATAGPSSILAYVVAGLFQMFLMIALAELAVGMPHAGAMDVWVRRFMGRWWGFCAGFTFALGWLIAGGSVGLAMGRITTYFTPGLQSDGWAVFFGILFTTIFAVLNVYGSAIAARTQLYLVMALTAIMLVFGLVGIKDVNPALYSPWLPNGWSGFWAAIPLGTYAYLGAVTLTTAGSECERPVDLARALIWSSLTFLVLYTLAHAVVVGIVPWNEVTMDVSPFTRAAEVLFGPVGGIILNLAAWLAAATCVHMGTLYATSRVFWAQAREGLLPGFFGYLHPRYRTPVWGIAFIWLVSSLLIVLGVKNPDLIYVHLSLQLVLAWSVSWLLAVIAAVLYRARAPQEVAALPWRQPAYPLFPLLGVLGIAVVVYGTFVGTPQAPLYGAIWLVALYLYYRFYVQRSRGVPSRPPATAGN
ncbi:amino acid permease-associated region [Thermaerobacter marianensis DSM 12885]|uniref:Amino acid permease-associated region n=1 Tax=Thermaerobacter marianensis (strain ATCC 700841 / DSM 12885 / JCM 10246 / 7p75a) TaxID=644966 RepID=E6SIQ2_THEM7|nr:amino acid permease [Thermaerobacter marianensis]ADU51996.1 amino acid permease-associated region [Thermaerobacter marianensis DSM 12885]